MWASCRNLESIGFEPDLFKDGRVRVPKSFIFWPYSSPHRGTKRSKYIQFLYMDP